MIIENALYKFAMKNIGVQLKFLGCDLSVYSSQEKCFTGHSS